jgi:hypothetical protein
MKTETVDTPDGLMLKGASPELLRELLNELFDVLGSVGLPVAASLAPGLTSREIRELLLSRGLSAPNELTAWYETFNGTTLGPTQTPVQLFPVYDLHSLETAVALYDLEPASRGVGVEDWNWHPEWLRIAEPVQSLAVRCSADEEGPPLVRAVGHDYNTQAANPPYQVVSLCTPVAWWIEELQNGSYVWDAARGLWNVEGISADHLSRRVAGFI